MHNWDYRIQKGWKPGTDAEWVWYLERMINHGMGKEKLPARELKKYFHQIKITPNTKAFLELILWEKPY